MFKLFVVTPVKVFFEDEVTSVVAPGEAGYLGILSHHAPLITALKPGTLTIEDRDERPHRFDLTGGFLEVSNNRVTILADSIEVGTPPERGR